MGAPNRTRTHNLSQWQLQAQLHPTPMDAKTRQQKLDPGRARFRTWQLYRARGSIASSQETNSGYEVQTSPQGWQAQHPQALFATPTAKQNSGDPLAYTINSVRTAPVDSVRDLKSTVVGKPMALTTSYVQTLETVFTPGGTCSTLHVPTVMTTPNGETPATGESVSTFCMTNPSTH